MKHLLAISVGPVQEFIAAARRTRDLWFGSHLLSEISKSVARSVREKGGKLIFPHPDTDLTENKEDVNVANIILAELDGDDDPSVTASCAKESGQERWRCFAENARSSCEPIIRTNVWNEQVDDVLEFYAAWVQYDGDDRYADARKRVMRLLEGRKTCRDFKPARGVLGLPKSSLDAQRETVLKKPPEKQREDRIRDKQPITEEHERQWRREQAIRCKLRIKDGEQLDVVGLVKRCGVGSKSYPSVSRVAADPWIRGIANNKQLREIRDAVHKVLQLHEDAIQRLGGGWEQLFSELPFEGTVVYRGRHHELLEETKLPEEALKPLADALGKSEPNPYLAVLMADGDRMGEVISKLDTPDKHRAFSKTLSRFASKASEIVRNHRGVLIYSGGDDVLAFLPADKCLGCARALHDTFGDLLEGYKVDQHSPTLSVGIAIAHFMDDLEELRQYALDAEKSAKKPDRDGLAVHLHKRSGSPTCVRSRWSANPDESLMRYAGWIRQDAIPSKLPYDLRKLVRIYDDKNWQDANTRQEALQADVLRIIKDKQPRGKKSEMPAIASAIESRVKDSRSLETFCEELLVARLIAEVMEQAEPRKSSRQVAEVTS